MKNMLHMMAIAMMVVSVSIGATKVSKAEEKVSPAQSIVHEVRWGDTLARIAHRYYGEGKKFKIIATANNILNPDRIVCGRRLTIPPDIENKTIAAGAPASESALEAEAATPVSIPAPGPQVLTAPARVKENRLLNVVQSTAVPAVSAIPFQWRQEKCTAFGEREKLTFSVKWQFVTVGSATMEIQGLADINGRTAFHVVTEAKSAPFFDAFYRVRDTNESWIDTESLCSLKYASRISESNAKRDETVLFDQENREFHIEESGKTGPIPQWVQDVLSSLYYLRNKDLVTDKEYSVDAHSGDKSWPLTVKVVGREKIKVPAGEFQTIVLEPSIRDGAGIFQAKGKLLVWMTADDRKIPVLMRFKIAVGAIEAQLIKIER